MRLLQADVSLRVNSGRDVLAASLSGFDPKRHSCTATHVVSAHDFADALCTFAKVLPSPLVLSESFSRIFSASNIFAGACSGATGAPATAAAGRVRD